MARIRSVSPEILDSETLAQLSAEGERTFVRLWTVCDDEGRCEDRPKLLKAWLYPEHDDVTVEDVDFNLAEMSDLGLIQRYEVEGKRYLFVRSWKEFQHPQRPRPSKVPPPPDYIYVASLTDTGHVPDESATEPVHVPVGVEWSGDGEGVLPDSATDTGLVVHKLAEDEKNQFLILAEKAMARRSAPPDYPAAWLKAVEQDMHREHGDRSKTIQAEHPDWSAQQIADEIDPPSVDPYDDIQLAAQKLAEKNALPPCDRCESTGWLFDDDGVAIGCPDCTRVAVA